MSESANPIRIQLPKIWGTQIGLKDPDQVDGIKASMVAGRFTYAEADKQIAGVRVARSVYYVKDGHHRMAAAMEIYRETGDATPIRELLRWGRWADVANPPIDARPLPARDWWGKFRNWFGY